VIGEPLDMLAKAISVERLDCPDNPRVKLAALLLKQPGVRDLMREGMLERVLEIRKQTSVIEEIASLETIEPATKSLIRQFGDRLEQCEWHVLADD
jgi:hypothetical protein